MRKRTLPLWMVLILMALMVALLATCAFAGSPPVTSTGCQSITVSANTEITVPDTGPAIAVHFTYTPSTPIAETHTMAITSSPALQVAGFDAMVVTDTEKKIATPAALTNEMVGANVGRSPFTEGQVRNPLKVETMASVALGAPVSPPAKCAGADTIKGINIIAVSPPATRTAGTEITTPTLRPPSAAEITVATMGKTLDTKTATCATTTSPPTAIICSTREGLVNTEMKTATATNELNAAATMEAKLEEGAVQARNVARNLLL